MTKYSANQKPQIGGSLKISQNSHSQFKSNLWAKCTDFQIFLSRNNNSNMCWDIWKMLRDAVARARMSIIFLKGHWITSFLPFYLSFFCEKFLILLLKQTFFAQGNWLCTPSFQKNLWRGGGAVNNLLALLIQDPNATGNPITAILQ